MASVVVSASGGSGVVSVVDPFDASAWVQGLPGLISGLQGELAQVRVDLAVAAVQVDAWYQLNSTPKAESATKASYVQPGLDHWQKKVAELKSRAGILERDAINLQVILDAQAQ